MKEPTEDLAVDLAGLIISETYPHHKKAVDREKWFQYWFRQLRRAIKKHAKSKQGETWLT